MHIPVITLDGPAASGKGTVAKRVAIALGWHYLDSGALYRLTGLAARQAGIAADDVARLTPLAQTLDIAFTDEGILLGGVDVSEAIRGEEIGEAASKIATIPGVRAALLQRQRDFRQAPGLVTDGRDMGTVVFPDATLKVFLTAGVETRAQRRARQLAIDPDAPDDTTAKRLISKENYDNLVALFRKELQTVLTDLKARDARDSARSVAPLQAALDAKLLDTTSLSIHQAADQVLSWFEEQERA